jgi:hypothetical protein
MLSIEVALLLLVQVPGAPQGFVQGTVRDATTGMPIAGASLFLTDLGWGAVAGEDGTYLLSGVPAGPQHLVASALGYSERTIHALVPRSAELRLDVVLEPRPLLLAPLEVRLERADSELEGFPGWTQHDRRVSAAEIRTHPLLAEPDPFLAVAGGEVFIAPEAPSGIHLFGGAAEHTGYALDGIPVLNPHHAAGLFSAWNPDAIAEVGLSSTLPSLTLPITLSGSLTGRTRAPGPRFGARGALSTTQGRLTLDGPLGLGEAGYLASWRTGFPGLLGGPDEPSYLGGESSDLLLKLQVPGLAGGRLEALYYASDNELSAARDVPVEDAPPETGPPPRHSFEWRSGSFGFTWSRAWASTSVGVSAWRARTDGDAEWFEGDAAHALSSRRVDVGAQVLLGRETSLGLTRLGVRAQRIRTEYVLEEAPPGGDGGDMDAGHPLGAPRAAIETSLTFEHSSPAAGPLVGRFGASLSTVAGRVYAAPRAGLEWRASDATSLAVTYTRALQFTQSASNPESLVRFVFPTELAVVAGRGDVPIPTSDLGVLSAEWRPSPGVSLGAKAFIRRMDRLLLVGTSESGPFADAAPSIGSGAASGLALDASATGARVTATASYAWQRLELESHDAEAVPSHGAAHRIDAGIVVFPTPTFSTRASVAAAFGRKGTAIAGAFEWEACNALDRGCEFAGAPLLDGPVGGVSLPAYLRIDLGLRKHWHVRLGGRDTLVAAFMTVTNLFGRRNVLAYATDPDTGVTSAIEMLPFSPLALGVDWEF